MFEINGGLPLRLAVSKAVSVVYCYAINLEKIRDGGYRRYFSELVAAIAI